MVFGDSNSGAKVVSRLVLPWSHGHSPGVAIAVSPLGQGADVLIGKLFLYDVPGLIHFVHMSNVVEFLSHIMFHRADTITSASLLIPPALRNAFLSMMRVKLCSY
jgi:hypothetical protein